MNKKKGKKTFVIKSRELKPHKLASAKPKNEELIPKISLRARAKMGAQGKWNIYKTKKNNFKIGSMKRYNK